MVIDIKICLIRFLLAIFFLPYFVPFLYGATIDVMIVYDTSAKTWVSSHGGMTAFAEDAVARMNQATANSNLSLTFRLVYTGDVSYTHSGNLSTDLNNLQTGTGNLSAVHKKRDSYGADVVAMMVDTGSAYGTVGVGYLLTSYSGQPKYAYSTEAIRAVNISHTLTHEVGHNLGCHHSKYQKDSPGPNTYLNNYSAGWYFTGTNGAKYHTIMAYNNDGYGNTYSEAPLFSTPLISYQSSPAGDTQDGDNTRNIRGTMDTVAAYRQTIPTAVFVIPYLNTLDDFSSFIKITNLSTNEAIVDVTFIDDNGNLINHENAVTIPPNATTPIDAPQLKAWTASLTTTAVSGRITVRNAGLDQVHVVSVMRTSTGQRTIPAYKIDKKSETTSTTFVSPYFNTAGTYSTAIRLTNWSSNKTATVSVTLRSDDGAEVKTINLTDILPQCSMIYWASDMRSAAGLSSETFSVEITVNGSLHEIFGVVFQKSLNGDRTIPLFKKGSTTDSDYRYF